MIKNKSAIVLNALLMGETVALKLGTIDVSIKMFKHGDIINLPSGEYECNENQYWIGTPVLNKENTYLGLGDIGITDFITSCNNLSDEYIHELTLNMTLTRINRKERG